MNNADEAKLYNKGVREPPETIWSVNYLVAEITVTGLLIVISFQ